MKIQGLFLAVVVMSAVGVFPKSAHAQSECAYAPSLGDGPPTHEALWKVGPAVLGIGAAVVALRKMKRA